MTTNFHQISKDFNVDQKTSLYLFVFLFVSCLLCFWNWSVFAVSFCHDLFCCCCFFPLYFVMQNGTHALADQQGLL